MMNSINLQHHIGSCDYQKRFLDSTNSPYYYVDQHISCNSDPSYLYFNQNNQDSLMQQELYTNEPTYLFYDIPSYDEIITQSSESDFTYPYIEENINNRKRSNEINEHIYDFDINIKRRYSPNDEMSFENASSEDQNIAKINKNREAARKFRKKRQLELEELKLKVEQLSKKNREYAEEEKKIKEENEKKMKEAEELYKAVQSLISYTFSQISSSQYEQILTHMKANNMLIDKL